MTEVNEERLDAEILAYLKGYGPCGGRGGRGGVSARRINADIEYLVTYVDVQNSIKRLQKEKLITNLYKRGKRWYATDIL